MSFQPTIAQTTTTTAGLRRYHGGLARPLMPGWPAPRPDQDTAAGSRVERMGESMLQDKISRMLERRTAPLVLELDLTDGLAEEPPTDPVSAFLTMRRPRLADVLDGLRRARADDRVRALVVKVGGRPIGMGRVQDLRDAITDFAASGKTTVAWAETFGEMALGNLPYYLATAFGKIYLQPSGDLGLTGISLRQLFFRGALDKLGLDV